MRDSWYNGLSASFLEDDKRQNAGRLRQIERIRMRLYLTKEKMKLMREKKIQKINKSL